MRQTASYPPLQKRRKDDTHRVASVNEFKGRARRRRLGRIPEARASYEKALALTQQERERRFLARRLEELK